mmetsp:Transcript_49132/g.80787  ORF Transcript_49132/g.80787 Transcript_49132/m.80787 type:complete len:138 (+) Transcript_49132:393-806(+)
MSDNDHDQNSEPTTGSGFEDENLESEGDGDIETNDPLPFDQMTQLLAEQMDADIIEEDDFLDIFDPLDDDEDHGHVRYSEAETQLRAEGAGPFATQQCFIFSFSQCIVCLCTRLSVPTMFIFQTTVSACPLCVPFLA